MKKFTSIDKKYSYDGPLGAIYKKDQTTFLLWSPLADGAVVKFYPDGGPSSLVSAVLPLKKTKKGVWSLTYSGDLKNTYYTYAVKFGDHDFEAIDPYAKAAGVNGTRGMVVDLPAPFAPMKTLISIKSISESLIDL